jgi:hypothetical protein
LLIEATQLTEGGKTMSSLRFRRALARLAGAVLLLYMAATPGFAEEKKKAKKPKASSQAKSTKFVPGSQETPKERVARLQRECKGQVNAGACEGHTR